MFYDYKCEDNHETEIQMSISEDIPKIIKCEKCAKDAHRTYGLGYSIIIPDHMRAIPTDGSAGTFSEFSNLKSTFSNAKRPSGKEKIYY